MSITLKEDEFDMLRVLVEQECGISVTREKMYLFESRLAKLVLENGCQSFGEFYLKAKNNTSSNLRSSIIDAITTNETLWFRDESPFVALREKLLPEFATAIQEGKKYQLRIWSAACSTGQEPYSIAITVRETKGLDVLKGKLTILATDISSSALFIARTARYDSIAVSRGLPNAIKERYFEEKERVHVLKDEIRSMVNFQQFNLQQSFEHFGKFDIIFLRNVAIYFSHEFKTDLFKRLYAALNPGGYLILGSSEHLQAYNQDFVLREHGRCMFYQRPIK